MRSVGLLGVLGLVSSLGCSAGTERTAQPPAISNTEPQPDAAVAEAPVEATSLFGEPLRRKPLPDDVRTDREAKLAEAKATLASTPGGVEELVWVGRRTAYLGRYQDAIELFSQGLEANPDEPHLLRHRGHRYITIREFSRSVQDLSTAAEAMQGIPVEVEQDGLPNAAGVPTGTLQSNVLYHLGLAQYLQGQFGAAVVTYVRGLGASTTDDTRVAMTHWAYMALRRGGQDELAERVLADIPADVELFENHAYARLLSMYRGEVAPEQVLPEDASDLDRATLGYGVGNYYFVTGQRDRAIATWRSVLATGRWDAFGYIAAEADLHRLESPPAK